MIKIILADDHKVIRQQLKRLLVKVKDWEVSAEAEDGRQAVRLVKNEQPDVLITDLALPGLHGLEVASQAQRDSERTRVVVVSIHDDEQYVRQALENGVLGYVRKDEIARHLLPAVRSALAGRRYLSPALPKVHRLPGSTGQPVAAQGSGQPLSSPEKTYLRLLTAGLSDTEIARQMEVSTVAASLLRTRLLQRLEVKTAAELIALAREKGLVDDPNRE
ncbi:MAG TPA: hypothetical protein DCY13_22930 [Verrucomicrobiales bacterium]|nr:hypothetical protein [Verrucomicrobiales bacterium]